MSIEEELIRLVPQKETALTVGVFDGVHRGHRYLLNLVKRQAQQDNLLSGVVTFKNHPQLVVHPQTQIPFLCTVEERVELIKEMHVDLVAVLSFTPEVAQMQAQEFLALLKKYLKMRHLVIGPDFALGKERKGNFNLIRETGEKSGFSVSSTPPFFLGNDMVSSTCIRSALSRGEVGIAEKLLGRRFSLTGEVVTTDKRGHSLGFPTANLSLSPEMLLPTDGVYATIAQIAGSSFASVTNIGIRPTFNSNKRTIETHLLNYDGDLYGQKVKLEFVQRLREEHRFNSIAELKAQIERDIENTEAILCKK
jgi:riboflavin kinase / FMN adenylyltransferase